MNTATFRPIFSFSGINKKLLFRTISATSDDIKVKDEIPLKSWKEIPGPSCLPIIGSFHHFLPGGKLYNLNGLELTKKLYEENGPIILMDGIFGREPFILLYDAESASQILRTENALPIRPGFKTLEYYRENLKKDRMPGRPTGLITDHGENWKEMRSVVNPVLLQPKTIKLYTSVLDEVSLDMVKRLKSLRDENNMIAENFDQEMNKWSLESIGVVALGCRLNCLDPNLAEDSPVRKLIKVVHELFVVADKLEFRPSLWRIFATPTFKEAMRLYEEQETLAKYFISMAIKEFQNKNNTDDEKGILEKLLEVNESFAYIMASDMLFAGVDTAANSITGALYLLAKNPNKQNRLRKELLSNPEKRPYLKAVIKEAIRIMPVVSGNLRQTTREYNILGYKIPIGMQVAFGHQDMSLMDEHFTRSKEFLPERWLADKDDPLYYRNAHPFAYNPFGFGVRSCVGRRIAELELETFLARLIENFCVEWIGEPPKVVQTSINYIKGPFNFIFKDVK